MSLHSSPPPRRSRRVLVPVIAAAAATLLIATPLSAWADDATLASSERSSVAAQEAATVTEEPGGDAPQSGASRSDQGVPVESAPTGAPTEQSQRVETSTPSASTSDAPATRTISGTIHFDPATTREQRESVTVEAVAKTGNGKGVGTVSYDPTTGAYVVSDLAPDTYRLWIRMVAGEWYFAPSARSTTTWDTSDGEWDLDVDVVDADRTGRDVYFDQARAGVEVYIYGLPVRNGAKLVATDVATGAESTLDLFGGGQGMAIWNGLYAPGTIVTVRAVVDGQNVYYDGTDFSSPDPAKAVPVTVGGPWTGERITMNVGDFFAPSWWEFTNDTRGPVLVPDTATEGDIIAVYVGTARAGESVRGWMYSSPTPLGRSVVDANGYANFRLAAGLTGDHRIAVSTLTDELIGWGDIQVDADTPADKSGTAAAAAARTLAATGAEAPALLTSAAIAALLVGGAAMVVARRRRVGTR